MIEITVIAIIGSSILIVLGGVWAYRELSGPQIFQMTMPKRATLKHPIARRRRSAMPMKRQGQQGYINLFAKLVIKKKRTVKSKSGKEFKAPWGW